MTEPSAAQLSTALADGIVSRWYPRVIDAEQGGYFTNLSSDWALLPSQEKMIVGQARHVWTLSKLAGFLATTAPYEAWARHGFAFLRDAMWDPTHGGYFQIRSRNGGPSDVRGWRDEKRAYGNAFAVYALAALYELTRDPAVLDLARDSYRWLEAHAFDPEHGGYFQFLTREGRPFGKGDGYESIAADANEVGFKDQNSSIHLLEAYTALYRVWPDPGLRRQLEALLALIRDLMVAPPGYLRLFFSPDWTPVSFRDAPVAVRAANYGLDHVSFGHDYETAFLMLEASHALGLDHDRRTLSVAKRMLDHALQNGWDAKVGGFFDGGYYFDDHGPCRIVKETKNWWAQAEALNVLLLFSRIFPNEPRYLEIFVQEWRYVDRFILDHERGDWFEGGLDKEPALKDGPKSHLWKCTYHTSRALMNCLALTAPTGTAGLGPRFEQHRQHLADFTEHWRRVAAALEP